MTTQTIVLEWADERALEREADMEIMRKTHTFRFRGVPLGGAHEWRVPSVRELELARIAKIDGFLPECYLSCEVEDGRFIMVEMADNPPYRRIGDYDTRRNNRTRLVRYIIKEKLV